jgi:galactose oxidase
MFPNEPHSWLRKFKTQVTAILTVIGLVILLILSSFRAVQALPYAVPQQSDPLIANLSNLPNDAPTKGMWSTLQTWPLVAIHAGVLPDGNVITFGTPVGQGVQDGRVFDIWDPRQGFTAASHQTTVNAQGVDSFCAAATHLPSGSLLVSGGNAPLAGSLFSPLTDTASPTASLNYQRWYASLITLADGRALITGGSQPYAAGGFNDPTGYIANSSVSMTPEVFAPATGWQPLSGATSRDAFGPDYNRYFYPRNWVAPNGKVFGISTETMWYLDPSGSGSVQVLGKFKSAPSETTRPNVGPTSTAVMYDTGKILQVGGNGYNNDVPSTSSNSATVVDITGAPTVRDTTPMNFGRQWAESTVLPNGQVLVSGGTRYGNNGDPDAVHATEIWNPQTGQWTVGASEETVRVYHATAILLPNGTVLTAGGGVPGPVTNLNAAVYYPPYLFTTVNGKTQLASRPKILSLDSNKMPYNTTFQAQMATSEPISKVTLIGLSNGTHSFNSGQRLYNVSFTQKNQVLSLKTPANGNQAPPGYYLVSAVNASGVPSSGAIVAVGNNTVTPPGTASPSSDMTVVNNNGSSIQYTNWSYIQDPNALQGDVHATSVAGASASFNFSGTQVALYGGYTEDSGLFDIYLDGIKVATIDQYRPLPRTYKQLLWQSGALTDGAHTLRIVNTGQKNAASTNTWVNLDSLAYVPPVVTWSVCAQENQTCAFTGTKTVRFGANGVYATKSLTNGTLCSNSVFGDPIYGAAKQCEISSVAPPPWTFCAYENGVCTFSGTQTVRYGANGTFYSGTFASSVACTNAIFGDPTPGLPKQCESSSTVSPDWTLCAPENGFCSFTGTKTVRYGANGAYSTKTFTNGTGCNNVVFGDPAPGVYKQCEVK